MDESNDTAQGADAAPPQASPLEALPPAVIIEGLDLTVPPPPASSINNRRLEQSPLFADNNSGGGGGGGGGGGRNAAQASSRRHGEGDPVAAAAGADFFDDNDDGDGDGGSSRRSRKRARPAPAPAAGGPEAVACGVGAEGRYLWEVMQSRLLPGYVLSPDGAWAYGPKDPREGVRLATVRERRFRIAERMARRHRARYSPPGGGGGGGASSLAAAAAVAGHGTAAGRVLAAAAAAAASNRQNGGADGSGGGGGGVGGDDSDGDDAEHDGSCTLCEFLEDVDRSKTVSTAVNMINSAADAWTNGRTEQAIAVDMASMWNNSVAVHAQRMQIDIPRLTPDDVARHRRNCLVRNFDARLSESIARATDLADTIGDTAVYRWRVNVDGSMSHTPEIDPKGARLWLSAFTGQCRLIREARGAVSSRYRGANAARKEFGADDDDGVGVGGRMNKMSVVGGGSSGGGMSVMRVGGAARAPM